MNWTHNGFYIHICTSMYILSQIIRIFFVYLFYNEFWSFVSFARRVHRRHSDFEPAATPFGHGELLHVALAPTITYQSNAYKHYKRSNSCWYSCAINRFVVAWRTQWGNREASFSFYGCLTSFICWTYI